MTSEATGSDLKLMKALLASMEVDPSPYETWVTSRPYGDPGMTPAVHKEIAGVLWLVVVGFGVFGVWFFIQKGEAGLVVILIFFFSHCKGILLPTCFRNTRYFNCASQNMLKKCVCTLPILPLLCALNIFGVGEFSNGSVNLLFTSINKIRYKLLQYKLPCSGPPLTLAIN